MTAPRFRPPQQPRSQETLDKILDAAEHVLDEKSFTEATLAEIMERAGVTVGAFYRRFPDKDALLHLLDERFFQEMHEHAETILNPARWDNTPIWPILNELGRTAADVYRARRGLLRSLFLRARVDPVIQRTARQVNEVFHERLRAVLLAPGRREQITHPNPERAIALGFIMFVGALREATIFGEIWPEYEQLTRDDLGDEMARLYGAYLGVAIAR
ncbi:MAG TPA: TetR/AcrR family transcriptional regulator [Gemmatimonadaceae bacterium]|nr:TetR/AcrR family transcriptional regulator [Gemmatimonadaceae bacterium]